MENIIKSRTEEGTQSRLTLSSFYQRYISSIEAYNNDLNFETISEIYAKKRDMLLNSSDQISGYLSYRKNAIIALSDASSAYKSAKDYKERYEEYYDKALSSRYSSDSYWDWAEEYREKKFEKELELIFTKFTYLTELIHMDSCCRSICAYADSFNLDLESFKLFEKLKVPEAIDDTINDWLISRKSYIRKLEVD